MKRYNWRLPFTYARIPCACGEVLHFHHNFPAICNRCGRKVYPTNRWKFRDEIRKYINKLGGN